MSMKKVENNGLQITGIIIAIVAIAGIVQPLIKALLGAPLTFSIFNIVPDGTLALLAWIVILVIGLALVSVTKPLKS